MATLLSKKTDYALLILSHLAERPAGDSAREIAERFDLSKGFVANILKELSSKGFVVSHRGVKGGYSLQRPAEKISLAELLEAMEDGLKLTTCMGESGQSSHDCAAHSHCTIRGPLNEIHRAIFEVLRGVTLADLFHPTTRTTFQPVLSVLRTGQPRPEETLQEIPA